MTVTISFRVAEQLEEFLEEEAQRQMTTKSAVARQLLTEKVRETIAESTDEEEGADTSEPDSLESVRSFSFGSKSAADAVRKEFSEYVSGKDDARFTTVWMAEGTPGKVVKEIERRSEF